MSAMGTKRTFVVGGFNVGYWTDPKRTLLATDPDRYQFALH
jgi:hypothetical protein